MSEYTLFSPCPFCGSEEIELIEYSDHELETGYSWTEFYVECLKCECNGSKCETEQEAYDYWQAVKR